MTDDGWTNCTMCRAEDGHDGCCPHCVPVRHAAQPERPIPTEGEITVTNFNDIDPDEQIIEEIIELRLTDRVDEILAELPPERQAGVQRAIRRLSLRSQRDIAESWRALSSDSRRVIDPPAAATWAWSESEMDDFERYANEGQ